MNNIVPAAVFHIIIVILCLIVYRLYTDTLQRRAFVGIADKINSHYNYIHLITYPYNILLYCTYLFIILYDFNYNAYNYLTLIKQQQLAIIIRVAGGLVKGFWSSEHNKLFSPRRQRPFIHHCFSLATYHKEASLVFRFTVTTYKCFDFLTHD